MCDAPDVVIPAYRSLQPLVIGDAKAGQSGDVDLREESLVRTFDPELLGEPLIGSALQRPICTALVGIACFERSQG